jgi:dephospho-CoA kinase
MTVDGRPLRIGLTGPIGCGKTTIARRLGQHDGVVVVDADIVAREVLDPGTPELDAVYRRFGEDLRRPDGSLDRAALGRIVFADPDALRELESIVHPAVRPRILEVLDAAAQAGARAVVVEAIKLVEGGLAALCDEVWLVTCDPASQRDRLEGRGMARPDADARVAAQAVLSAGDASVATRTLSTEGSLRDTLDRADAFLAAALAAAPGVGRAADG